MQFSPLSKKMVSHKTNNDVLAMTTKILIIIDILVALFYSYNPTAFRCC